jgi:hypothetical protein
MLADIPRTDDERFAIDDGQAALDQLLDGSSTSLRPLVPHP